MIWKLLAAPVIGAIIGYCTNWLAVKMLFRPREEKYIFGIKLPFTPGVIPKGKKRLAAAVGRVVNEQLITKEAVEAKLLAPEMIHMIKSSVNERAALIKSDGEKTIRETLEEAVAATGDRPAAPSAPQDHADDAAGVSINAPAETDAAGAASRAATAVKENAADPAVTDPRAATASAHEQADPAAETPAQAAAAHQETAAAAPQPRAATAPNTPQADPAAALSEKLRQLSDITVYEDTPERRVNDLAASAKTFITDRIFEKVSGAGFGQIAADTVNEKLSQALAGSFIGQMMGGSVTHMMGPAIAQTVDGYIAEHGRDMIGKMVGEEIDSVLDMKTASIIEAIDKNGIDIGAKAADVYAAAVKKKSGEMLEKLNIGGIMQDTIENMDNEQLEDLVMSTMKTELGAVVNFGAIIGLALGIVNMIIYLL